MSIVLSSVLIFQGTYLATILRSNLYLIPDLENNTSYELMNYPFTPQILILTHQLQRAFENIVGKGEIARKEQFLLFPRCFLLNQIIVSPFVHIFDIISFFAAESEEPKIGILGKGLFSTFPSENS